MKALVHRAAGWRSAPSLYSNKTARTLRNVPRRRSSQPQVAFRETDSSKTLQQQVSWRCILLILIGCSAVLSTILLNWSTFYSLKDRSNSGEKLVSKIAFGSSSARHYTSQPVWINGVIPSDPDVWIWVGDMAYMDEARVNCDGSPMHPQCNCTADWLHQPPNFCMAGNLQHAAAKMQAQLANPDYAQFLAFMCPGHREKGLHPPSGSDPEVCPKAILGTYDDHDYGWSHGNKRLPQKDELKQVFLDAIGESPTSARRTHGRGIEWKYVLNEGKTGREVDVILLDTRYYREPLPCYTRQSFCEDAIAVGPSHKQYSWCLDFLQSGSCCNKDENLVKEWCLKGRDSMWSDLCDRPFPSFHVEMLDYADSEFCEILGSDQRKWLEDALLESSSPLKLIVSSSDVLPTSQKKPCSRISSNAACFCSGDDWDCYKPAQISLLEVASKASGCVVLLSGDLHYSDIRVLKPGLHLDYGGLNISYPLYQVRASGLVASDDTNFPCDEARRDPSGLRAHGECDFARAPSFGMIEVAWDEQLIKLQVRDGMTNEVYLESAFTLDSCVFI